MGNLNRLEEKVKFKIAIAKIDDEEKEVAMENMNYFISKKIGIVACFCFLLTTGIVFAKDIDNYLKSLFNNSNKAIDIAVENGYVQQEDMHYIYDKDIGIKVDNLVLDNLNLDISFGFEIKKENIKSIRLNDFIITNDNKKVVYRSELKSAETLDGLPLYNSVTWGNESIKLSDTTFTDSILFGLRPEKEDFKELYFDIKSVQIIYTDDTKEIIDGIWKFNVTIDNKMKNNDKINYILLEETEYVKSCTGTLSITGLTVKMNLSVPVDPMQYVLENTEEISDIGLFYLKYNNEIITPSHIELENINQTEYLIYYNEIGLFFDNIEKIELYLEPFDSSIILNKN